ncbi:hypothetical protein F4604DRAFT_1588080, partial [Suillus subluteus]
MPKDIKTLLKKKSRDFIWDSGGRNTVSLNTLCAPMSEGRKNMLNIEGRNEVIELNWLKGLLVTEENRAPWAHFAQAILAKHAQKAPIVHPAVRSDPFLQTWKPAITKLPLHLKRILKVTKKYNL